MAYKLKRRRLFVVLLAVLSFENVFSRREPIAAQSADVRHSVCAQLDVLADVDFGSNEFGGIDAVKEIQDSHETAIPTIYVSEHKDDIKTRLLASRNGGEEFFYKAVDPGQLIEKIEQYSHSNIQDPYRILVVDDSKAQAKYIENILIKTGMIPRVETDPMQVLVALDKFQPEIIIMDMYMPGCTGMELARVIRQQDKFHSVPIIYLSAEDDAMINVVASAGINVRKTAHLTIDNGNPGTADAGDEITFNISVENTGNMSMSNIVLNDDMAPLGVTCPSNSLAAFTSMNCDSYTYTVTQNDMNTGGIINNTVDLTAVDGASNNHQDSDTTQTVITLLAPVISSPNEGDLLNDNTPTVNGTGQPGAQIDVLTNQGGSCQAIVDPQGDWSCDISPAQTDGSLVISAFASDGGSNQSATDSVTVDLDATAPDAPDVDAPTNGQPVTGTGEPGATVTVTTESGGECTAVVQPDGTWSCTLTGPFADGDDITVTQEDDAGNESTPTIIPNGLDTEAPTVTITAPVDGDLTNDNTPTVSGTSEAGAEISVTIDGVEVCSAVADNNGDWSCDVSPAVADGSIQIDVTATDAASNTSNPESVTIDVDTTAPNAPLIDTPTNGQPVTGSGGEPGATVNVTTPSGASCQAIVQGDGSAKRTHTYLDSEDNIQTRNLNCTYTTQAPETITIASGPFEASKVEEVCESSGISFTNTYWLGGDAIVQSTQAVALGSGYIKVNAL